MTTRVAQQLRFNRDLTIVNLVFNGFTEYSPLHGDCIKRDELQGWKIDRRLELHGKCHWTLLTRCRFHRLTVGTRSSGRYRVQ